MRGCSRIGEHTARWLLTQFLMKDGNAPQVFDNIVAKTSHGFRDFYTLSRKGMICFNVWENKRTFYHFPSDICVWQWDKAAPTGFVSTVRPQVGQGLSGLSCQQNWQCMNCLLQSEGYITAKSFHIKILLPSSDVVFLSKHYDWHPGLSCENPVAKQLPTKVDWLVPPF